MMIRLDKYLAELSVGTRTEVKKKIQKGLVSVDGQICKKPETKVDTQVQTVICEGKEISYHKYEYYMFHKPAGCVSATEDGRCETVLDYIESPRKKELFPVGRLDKDTEGLLLITNDGDLAHRLLSPKKHVDKVYYAIVEGCITKDVCKQFEEGILIGEEEITMPAHLEICDVDADKKQSEIKLTIQEGKYHQVKRMFESVGSEVLYLKRLSMGSLSLDQALPLGAYRSLTDEELKNL